MQKNRKGDVGSAGGRTSINITAEESTPDITINSSLNGTQYYSTQNKVTFNGTASDPQEGDTSS